MPVQENVKEEIKTKQDSTFKKSTIKGKEAITVTIEQIRAVLAEKSQAGLTDQVRTLLEKFGANKLSAVNPEDYVELLTAAKDLR